MRAGSLGATIALPCSGLYRRSSCEPTLVFAHRQSHLTPHFSERIPAGKWCVTVPACLLLGWGGKEKKFPLRIQKFILSLCGGPIPFTKNSVYSRGARLRSASRCLANKHQCLNSHNRDPRNVSLKSKITQCMRK